MEIIEILIGILCVMAAFTVLRFMWPLLLIIAAVCFGYSLYVRYKFRKALRQQETAYDEMNQQFYDYQSRRRDEEIEKPVSGNDVIEAEYTERDVD